MPHGSKAAKIDLHGLPVEVAKVAVQVRWLGDGEPRGPSRATAQNPCHIPCALGKVHMCVDSSSLT